MKYLVYKSAVNIARAKKIDSVCLNSYYTKMLHLILNRNINACPYCHSANIIKYGHFLDNKQRHKCKDCGKTFSEVTNSIFSYSKKKIKYWLSYLGLMSKQFTIRESAHALKISPTTAFYWRHKILKVLNDNLPSKLSGVIEIKTTYIKESFKGKRYTNNFNRPISVGNIHNDFADIADRRVCVLCCHDNSKTIFSKTLCRGSINYTSIYQNLKDKLPSDCELCTDNNMAYVSLAKKLNIKLHKLKYGTQILEGKYHIKNAAKFDNNLKEIVSKCRGVCTRYLNFYIAWIKWLFNNDFHNCIINIIKTLIVSKVKFTNKDLHNIGELG
ncbi:IS1595 family transposase [Clostridium oryzae]|uniref:ISXO2-like transposase domain-containing protein n=1 Tax=Clostridium oryzae TaxID=1450648 RepID=A0A1V4I8D1_9CLOT|nr:IS1595 family transposase [Clostridium oryzae]OPJ56140.1 hypothetical protein CLORY_43180 [Clostridium oryzae]